jgi:putative endonuclease
VYILECADGTLYTGITNNLEARVASHNNGVGAKYTRGRRPVKLVWAVEAGFKKTAMMLEHHIKSYSRDKKLELIREN